MGFKTRYLFFVVVIFAVPLAAQSFGGTYYVDPNGNDSNDGTLGSPFATVTKALSLLDNQGGHTVYMRGGTYMHSSAVNISTSRSGLENNINSLLAYPGETPILDFSNQAYCGNNCGGKGLDVQADYWHVKGLTVQYAADNGVFVSGSNDILEQMVARQNQDSGFQISAAGSNPRRMPSNNLILNSDSYANFDYGTRGENADGFAIKFRDLGPGNVVDGARAWGNADDGFDFWQAEYGVTVKNSWSFYNGIASVFNNPAGYQGDSNGLKLGKDSGPHLLENLLVWGNDANGVDVNGNATELGGSPVVPAVIPHGVTVHNVTSSNNGGRNFQFDENPQTASPPANHVVKNSISFQGSVIFSTGNTHDHNTWNAGFPWSGASASDFLSTTDPVLTPGSYHPAGTGGDRDGTTTPIHATGLAVGPRQEDGSLPLLDFLRLAPGSHLIDVGVDVGLPYNGLAPDLGWFETTAAKPILAGDYNDDGKVSAADYTVWRDNLGANISLENEDASPGVVDEEDYDVWLEHYGETSLGSGLGSAASLAAVPEPSAILIAAIVAGLLVAGRRAF